MQSIRESVHQLLEDQITRLGLQAFYEVQKAEIIGLNGTSFTFHGLRDQSVHNIKSLEGADILWVEEAQNVSKKSWRTVIPTIRKPGSEIWISFNPELETDDTYQRFVVNPPPNAVVVKTSFRDNPALSEELRLETRS
jgi:phage terminase large subunit